MHIAKVLSAEFVYIQPHIVSVQAL